ncbi:MAG: NUDIX domain-containing protein [Oscillospiraceae bacterium]|nr:NUDIX domain-containing protein [Oscillospiraceae bacterium]
MAWPLHIVAAAGLVRDGAGRVLLVRHLYRGWEMPGGQVENGESIESAALREIFEESGIAAKAVRVIAMNSNVGAYMGWDGITPIPTKVIVDFLCDYVSGEPRPSDETAEARWVPAGEALAMVTAAPMRYRLAHALAAPPGIRMASYQTRPEFVVCGESIF